MTITEFNWDKFFKGEQVINYRTKIDLMILLAYLAGKDVKWSDSYIFEKDETKVWEFYEADGYLLYDPDYETIHFGSIELSIPCDDEVVIFVNGQMNVPKICTFDKKKFLDGDQAIQCATEYERTLFVAFMAGAGYKGEHTSIEEYIEGSSCYKEKTCFRLDTMVYRKLAYGSTSFYRDKGYDIVKFDMSIFNNFYVNF